MLRFSKGVLASALVLGFCAPGILSITMTGPSSAQANGTVTITWTSVSTDPTTFQIDIDEVLNSLQQSDNYFVIPNINTASGSATFGLPDLLVGTHRIAFSSDDGFQVLSQSSIEILPAAGSSSSSSALASSSTPSSSSSSPSPSPPTSSSSSQSSSSQSQTATSGADHNGVVKHHSNVGAIAGGVVGGIVVILLALLGWWYLRRRRASPPAGMESPGPGEITQFLAAPVSTGAHRGAAPAVHHGVEDNEFRPWEVDEGSAYSSTGTHTRAFSSGAAPSTSSTGTPAFSSTGTPAFSSTGTPAFSHATAPSISSSSAPTTAPSVSTRATAGAAAGATQGTSKPNTTRDRDRKQPLVMRWEPVGPDGATSTGTLSPHTQPQDDGPSREELLQEVQRLREQIEDSAPPEYSGPGL
ncbi:hypothetical protein MVEN_01148300 [Mycena venus]|uniref:Uncharacterized protein n=1 Tax=Mycena venus TaxID=2733690 RepID=A0A8H7CYB1_9AGAR|nr:hypothetical protein MVEN_01148300 [Mycena venus]